MMKRLCWIWLLCCPLIVVAQDSLEVGTRLLDEVVVSGDAARQRVSAVQIGAEQIVVEHLTSMPVLLGEADLMRSLQLLPVLPYISSLFSSSLFPPKLHHELPMHHTRTFAAFVLKSHRNLG